MNIYKIEIEYFGANYFGFQIQLNKPTIQGELHIAIEKIIHSKDFKTIGSGRTDAKVHAFFQVVKVEIPIKLSELALKNALNSHLPMDIRVKNVAFSDENFHPIYSAVSKEYHYYFSNVETPSVFLREKMANIKLPLNLKIMEEGCRLLCGEHEFVRFQCQGTEVSTTVRKIFNCEIVKIESSGLWSNYISEYFVLKITGNGFLKQMVRLIMGAIWNLGLGKITLLEFEEALRPIPLSEYKTIHLKKRLGPTAPPEGLYLMKVQY